MAYNPGANDAFQSGVNHQTNIGHANTGSLTLGDAGLQADSDHWNSLTPHGVLNAATGSQDDGSFQQYQREQGGYQPGSMTKMQDQLSAGNGDTA